LAARVDVRAEGGHLAALIHVDLSPADEAHMGDAPYPIRSTTFT